MIFGNKEKFAVECLKLKSSDGSTLIRSRIFMQAAEVGDFEELAVSGAILLAIDSFLNFADLRAISHINDETDFHYLHASMYGENWRHGMHENFRDKFSIHDLFEIAIADQGHVICLVTFSGESRILLGSRDGIYHYSVNVSESSVNSALKELAAWIKSES